LSEILRQRVLVGDGAMGTELYRRGVPIGVCFDELNLTRADLVGQVHSDYIDAGAEIIETNTFGANRLSLAAFGLAERVREINIAGVEIAKQAAAGRGVLVAGSVGPLPARDADESAAERTDEQVYEVYREQIEALAEAGADCIILETFTDLEELHLALRAAKDVADLAVIAQLTFHHAAGTVSGVDVYSALAGLVDAGADVVGTNCGRGVAHVLRIVEEFASRSDAFVSAFPNAGLPEYVGGRVMYLASPQYMADMAEKMVEAGANIVGGCCGTGPREIAAMAERIKGRSPAVRVRRPAPVAKVAVEPVKPPPRKTFLDRLPQRKAVFVELDPPYGLNYDRLLEAARGAARLGVDGVMMGDCPLATLRMSNIAAAAVVQREVGVECIVHVSCRDHNLIGLQSLLMGAWALGIRSVLAITGDPAKMGNQPGASSVYDLNSIGLIRLIAGLNRGVNFAGASVERATDFTICCAFNPNVKNLAAEVRKLLRKVQAGAQCAFTQLVFDVDRFAAAVRSVRDAGITIPVIAGVMPLLSARNCEFIHNELPGCSVPDEIRRRMARTDRRSGPKEGLAIAREIIERIWDCCDGVYIVPPLNKYDLAAALAEFAMSAAGV